MCRASLRHPGVTAPGAVPTLTGMDETAEPAAWRELETAVDAALWRYAEAVTGQPRAVADGGPGVPGLFGAQHLHLARLSAARRLRAALDATDRAAARQAFDEGATHPRVADAAGMSRQAAWRRYGPAR
jgi:hypothetical protein